MAWSVTGAAGLRLGNLRQLVGQPRYAQRHLELSQRFSAVLMRRPQATRLRLLGACAPAESE